MGLVMNFVNTRNVLLHEGRTYEADYDTEDNARILHNGIGRAFV